MCNVCGSQITSPSFVGKKNSAFKGSYLKRAIFRGICLSVVSASISSLGIFNCLFCWIRLQGSVWDKYQERMTFLILWEHWGCCGREEWGWDGRAPLWFRLVPKENMKKRGGEWRRSYFTCTYSSYIVWGGLISVANVWFLQPYSSIHPSARKHKHTQWV